MKRIILAVFLAVSSSTMVHAWIDNEGSTFTVDGADGWEMKDIQNDCHDVTHHAWVVYNISTGAYNNRTWVYDTDLGSWIELKVSSTNADDVSQETAKSQAAKSFLYGYNGTAWDRLKSDGLHYLYVRTSTDSVTQSRIYDWNGTSWQTTDIYGLARSTAQDTTIRRIEDMNLALFGVARSSGMDLLIQRTEEELLALFGIARSTGINALLQLIEARLEHADTNDVKITSGNIFVTGMTTGSVEVTNFPADYPDSTAASSLSSIDSELAQIMAVVRSTPQAISPDYNNKISSGTCGKTFLDVTLSMTDSVETYSFYAVGGNAAVTASWTSGTIYVLEGIPIAPTRLPRPWVNPAVYMDLDAGTTLYYNLIGLDQ